MGEVPVGSHAAGDTPPQTIVSRIELHLEQDPCVGSLDRWARFYRWGTRPSDFTGPSLPPAADRHEEVEIVLREAGKFGYRPGSFIEPSPPSLKENEIYMEHDDRDYLIAFGTYTVAKDTLELATCGSNLSRSPLLD